MNTKSIDQIEMYGGVITKPCMKTLLQTNYWEAII